jgi:fructan beta-fructosidase
MTIPLELNLIGTPEGPRLSWTPVQALDSLRTHSWKFAPEILKPDSANPLSEVNAELLELIARFEPGDASEVIFNMRGATIVYDAKTQELIVNGHHAPAPLRGGKQQMRIYCDRTALEIFASYGLTYMPMPYTPKASDLTLGVNVKSGSANIKSLEVYELKSAWR